MANKKYSIAGSAAMAFDTAANWALQNTIIPTALLIYETDTKKIKIGEGKLYSETPYWEGSASTVEFTQAFKNMLDAAGTANGVALLDGGGKLPESVMPFSMTPSIVYVDNLAGRDAIPETERPNKLIFVIDASADPTVTTGAASYVWSTATWVKISEVESLDLDLSSYFHKSTDTLDNITDGTNFVKMTAAERVTLSKCITSDDTIVLTGLDAAGLAAWNEANA